MRAPPQGLQPSAAGPGTRATNHAGAERAKIKNGRQLEGVKQMLRHHDDMGGGGTREPGRSDASSRSGSTGPVKSRGEGGALHCCQGPSAGGHAR